MLGIIFLLTFVLGYFLHPIETDTTFPITTVHLAQELKNTVCFIISHESCDSKSPFVMMAEIYSRHFQIFTFTQSNSTLLFTNNPIHTNASFSSFLSQFGINCPGENKWRVPHLLNICPAIFLCSFPSFT